MAVAALAQTQVQAQAEPPAATAWQEVGRQGVVRIVIVPVELTRDKQAYYRQIVALCGTAESCFINFYTNSTGAPLTIPLPDAIAHEAVATYRRSAKRGSEVMSFSCRLALDEPNCF